MSNMAQKQELKFGCKEIRNIVNQIHKDGDDIARKLANMFSRIIDIAKSVDEIKYVATDNVLDYKAKFEIIMRYIDVISFYIDAVSNEYWEIIRAVNDISEFWPDEMEICYKQLLNQVK